MRFLLLLTFWATVFFVPSWLASHPYQQILASIAGQLVAPPGSEIEFVELELFYPFDIGVYLALCLASTWVPRDRRFRAIAIGVPVLMLLELLSLSGAMKGMLSVMSNPAATAEMADQVYRLATGIIRVTGLIAAAAVWVYFLGRERLSLVARTWLGE